MVSEQVNLIHERRPYGKIEKRTKSLHPNTYDPVLILRSSHPYVNDQSGGLAVHAVVGKYNNPQLIGSFRV